MLHLLEQRGGKQPKTQMLRPWHFCIEAGMFICDLQIETYQI